MTDETCTCGRSRSDQCWQCCQMRDGKATLDQIEAALLSDNIARRDEALDAAYVQIENLRVLLSEAKALNTELRLYWIASEDQVDKLRLALHSLIKDPPATADDYDTNLTIIQKMRAIARDALS